jgi:TATA-box binding protein (TBP) (component of TFIID and TFIIIB)
MSLNIENFDNLGISTRTIMAYSNIKMNLEFIFENFPVYDIDVPLTKKKRKPDIKKIKAPYGSIISLRRRNKFRGIITDPEVLEKENLKQKIGKKEKLTEDDILKIKYFGKKENKKANDAEIYQLGIDTIMKKITYFLNQVTCIMSLGTKIVNIMIFESKMKIAGCKTEDQAEKVVFLFYSYLSYLQNSYTTIIPNAEPEFILETVMINVDFKLGFPIDRIQLDKLMKNKKYRDFINNSTYEPTLNTNVNIKMLSLRPHDFRFSCISFKGNNMMFIDKVKENKYNTKKEIKNETTFLVFQSSKIIISGRYIDSMKESYNNFIEIIEKNRNLIEEKLFDCSS